jgi:hypothetical protein
MTLKLDRAALKIRLITKNRYTQLNAEWSVVVNDLPHEKVVYYAMKYSTW